MHRISQQASTAVAFAGCWTGQSLIDSTCRSCHRTLLGRRPLCALRRWKDHSNLALLRRPGKVCQRRASCLTAINIIQTCSTWCCTSRKLSHKSQAVSRRHCQQQCRPVASTGAAAAGAGGSAVRLCNCHPCTISMYKADQSLQAPFMESTIASCLCPLQGAPSVAQKVLAFQQAFWKFLRPHTIRGTILGSCAVTAKAVLENPQARTQFKHVWELFAFGLIHATTLCAPMARSCTPSTVGLVV